MYGAQDDARRRATDREYNELESEWGKYGGATPAPAQIGDIHAPSGVLTPAEIRAHLGPSDAVFFVAALDSGVYTAVMRQNAFAFRRISLSAADIGKLVSRLRASLDPENSSRSPDYDFVAAWQLYDALFRPFAQELEGVTRVFWIPDAALTKLPPTVLVSSQIQPASLADYRSVPWLARKYAFVTLPTVSAIALKTPAVALGSGASFVGIGDPALGSNVPEGGSTGIEWRGRRSIDELGRLPPLPETADELRQEASVIGGRTTLLLGAQATEPAVLTALTTRYQVVAFATHGLAAGDLQGLKEPALVLTPAPLEQRTSDNDGLLTESKIELMRIPADWVILSACNTAAPGLFGKEEPLSGLARAFFVAGARSMLVSHWRVNSQTAVRLTTTTIANWRKGVDQADALKLAIENVIDDPGHPDWAHPRMWAPFALVGVTSD
jgi:CHAT domain-containing protein